MLHFAEPPVTLDIYPDQPCLHKLTDGSPVCDCCSGLPLFAARGIIVGPPDIPDDLVDSPVILETEHPFRYKRGSIVSLCGHLYYTSQFAETPTFFVESIVERFPDAR